MIHFSIYSKDFNKDSIDSDEEFSIVWNILYSEIGRYCLRENIIEENDKIRMGTMYNRIKIRGVPGYSITIKNIQNNGTNLKFRDNELKEFLIEALEDNEYITKLDLD
ncbi:MAG: hypothetical protein KJ613_01270 [Nanoarchaeota archaeon]|nr:hypothetical protein [Nanoarchaeota archaeon]